MTRKKFLKNAAWLISALVVLFVLFLIALAGYDTFRPLSLEADSHASKSRSRTDPKSKVITPVALSTAATTIATTMTLTRKTPQNEDAVLSAVIARQTRRMVEDRVERHFPNPAIRDRAQKWFTNELELNRRVVDAMKNNGGAEPFEVEKTRLDGIAKDVQILQRELIEMLAASGPDRDFERDRELFNIYYGTLESNLILLLSDLNARHGKWLNAARTVRTNRFMDSWECWDTEIYYLRQMGSAGKRMIFQRSLERNSNMLKRFLLSIGPHLQWPHHQAGD